MNRHLKYSNSLKKGDNTKKELSWARLYECMSKLLHKLYTKCMSKVLSSKCTLGLLHAPCSAMPASVRVTRVKKKRLFLSPPPSFLNFFFLSVPRRLRRSCFSRDEQRHQLCRGPRHEGHAKHLKRDSSRTRQQHFVFFLWFSNWTKI